MPRIAIAIPLSQLFYTQNVSVLPVHSTLQDDQDPKFQNGMILQGQMSIHSRKENKYN